METQKIVPTAYSSVIDENILVIKRTALFQGHESWHGIQSDSLDHYLALIKEKKEFLPRSAMEQDLTYKQIIPYIIFTHHNNFFLMQRSSHASEKRLASKWTLGIGGHVREEDFSHDSLFAWAQREFHEEVFYTGNFSVKLIGLLNDDTNDVGKVHMGLVFLATGDSDTISVASELDSGSLVTLQTCLSCYDNLEPWSQFVVRFLQTSGE